VRISAQPADATAAVSVVVALFVLAVFSVGHLNR
jgi:hypothetical protein